MSFFSRLRSAGALPVEGHLPGFDRATGWLNSPPLGPAELQGKVVLVDFWTYTCINWLRTLAYVRAWADKYQDEGLVVVGVHTPEFPFERDVDNVRQAVKDMAVEYPVVLDSDYAIWQAFANRFWPAVYIADPEGRIRHHQFGEGDTQNAKWSSSGCWASPDATPYPATWYRSLQAVSRLRPTGRAWRLPRPTSATSKHEGWHHPAIQSSARPTSTSRPTG